jgi:hypothetical protein
MTRSKGGYEVMELTPRRARRLLYSLMEKIYPGSEQWQELDKIYWEFAGKGDWRPCGSRRPVEQRG